MGESIIDIEHLTKDYGHGRGVFDVSFSVVKGECFGFLGPNGAGKSTTIRHLMGFSKPQSGACLIKGKEANKDSSILYDVSYLPGEISLPRTLTGKEVLDIQGKLKCVINNAFRDYLVNLFKFDDSLLCKEMSLGSKRKLAIITCFMSDPDIIVLDEPSSGLDPEMQKIFISLIKAEKKRKKTILMSSHIFSEIDSCCDRIAVIKDGKIVSVFQADELKHSSVKVYDIKFSELAKMGEFVAEGEKFIQVLNKDSDSHVLTVSLTDCEINSLIKRLSQGGVTDFTERKQTLEDYFMSFYKEDKDYTGIQR